MWTFSSKIGQALALALNSWILAWFAYKPGEISALSNLGIKLICGPLPLVWYLYGISSCATTRSTGLITKRC